MRAQIPPEEVLLYTSHARLPEPEDPRVLRLAADLANVRRQRDAEIVRARAEERAAGARRLADIHDDLLRSLSYADDPESPWARGQQAIVAKVDRLIGDAGARPVGADGEAFDPTVHEAVAIGPGPRGTVVSVARTGFVLDDGTLVRPAQVVVGNG